MTLLCGFLKVRNEVVREGNIYRVLENMRRYCDVIVACDDASTDGTREILQKEIPSEHLVLVLPDEQDFSKELYWKQKMLDIVHGIRPQWVLWMDADEVLDEPGTTGIRAFCEEKYRAPEAAWRFHYTQLWRNAAWARTDDGFDDGQFIKLWKWSPGLSFLVKDGTHHWQFPQEISPEIDKGRVGLAPFECIHWGNFRKNLVWKCIQYWGGLGGVQRHLEFAGARYRQVGEGPLPNPFTDADITRIRTLRNLRGVRELFCVVIPTYNRAQTLPRTLSSLIAQTYERWVALVIDDGSTDNTPELMGEWQDADPRIFYARFNEHQGGVAVNEVGMAVACEWAEWWTRLGSDDWFMPQKLEFDAAALVKHHAVYGPFGVIEGGRPTKICNPPLSPDLVRWGLLRGQFLASWANCAVRTSVLTKIKTRYGNFVDPRLTNMEDFVFNARVAREVPWVWRGKDFHQHSLMIDPHPASITWPMPDAVWVSAGDGASANQEIYTKDNALSVQIIREEGGNTI